MRYHWGLAVGHTYSRLDKINDIFGPIILPEDAETDEMEGPEPETGSTEQNPDEIIGPVLDPDEEALASEEQAAVDSTDVPGPRDGHEDGVHEDGDWHDGDDAFTDIGDDDAFDE